jgi:hypothetical protein
MPGHWGFQSTTMPQVKKECVDSVVSCDQTCCCFGRHYTKGVHSKAATMGWSESRRRTNSDTTRSLKVGVRGGIPRCMLIEFIPRRRREGGAGGNENA